jgi:cytochrome P450
MTFSPDRWLAPNAARDACFVPFSRGSRACIGQNLAFCELFVSLGTLIRRFGDLKAPKLTEADETFVDLFNPFYGEGSHKLVVWRGGSGKGGGEDEQVRKAGVG